MSEGVTRGNLLSIAATGATFLVTIASVVWSWSAMNSAQIENAREIKRIELSATAADNSAVISHDKQMTDIRADLVQQRRSIQALEISDARNSERYEALARSMDELKAAQRETNDLLRQMSQSATKG